MAIDRGTPDERAPRLDVDFSTLGDDRLELHAESIWTCLLRAFESDRVNFSAEDVEMAWDVWLGADRDRLLDADELRDLETFECALVRQAKEGKHDPERSFSHLNAVETSFVRILQRAISRRLKRNVTSDVDVDDDDDEQQEVSE